MLLPFSYIAECCKVLTMQFYVIESPFFTNLRTLYIQIIDELYIVFSTIIIRVKAHIKIFSIILMFVYRFKVIT